MAKLQLASNGSGQLSVSARRQPSWQLPTYSPTSLNQHAQCAEAFLHERVLRTSPVDDQDRAALIKGSAAHALLERYIHLNPVHRSHFASNLEHEAMQALVAEGLTATDPGCITAVEEVASWASTGIDVLKNEFADARLLVGEQFLDLRQAKAATPFRLTAKVDLLALFPDGSVESLDWKTGTPRKLDQLQNVICRLVTEANAPQIFSTYLSGSPPTTIRTTVCHLSTRGLTVQEFDRPQLVAEFADIRARIERIEQAKATPVPGSVAWRPQPGPLCSWCKYAHACSAFAESQADELMAWLDGPSAVVM